MTNASLNQLDLIADGAVVIGIHDSDLYAYAGYKQAVTGCDIEQVSILLLSVQRPFHKDLPLPLNRSQPKHSLGISS